MPRPAGHALHAERLLAEFEEALDLGHQEAAAAIANAANAYATLHLAAVTRAKLVPPGARVAGEPLLLRPAEAARMLGISRSSVYKLITDGQLKAASLGGATVLPIEAVKAFAKAALAGDAQD